MWCSTRYSELPIIVVSVVYSIIWNFSKIGTCVDFKCLLVRGKKQSFQNKMADITAKINRIFILTFLIKDLCHENIVQTGLQQHQLN